MNNRLDMEWQLKKFFMFLGKGRREYGKIPNTVLEKHENQ